MTINQYEVVRDGVVTHRWTSEVFGVDHYEPSFGLPEREKRESDCTPEEIASAISSRTETDPDSGVSVVWYRLPAEFSIVTTDITEEIKSAKKTSVTAQITETWDIQIRGLLSGAEFVTKLGEAVAALDMSTNTDGVYTPEQVAYGKSLLPNFRALMNQIQIMRNQRDAEIAQAMVSIDEEFSQS
jgi:hypothetical protein